MFTLRFARVGRGGRRLIALLGAAVLLPGVLAPRARALEVVELRLPVLETSFTVKVSELGDPDRMFNGNSDLAELDRASHGSLGRRMTELFRTPLPVQTTALVQQAVGTPLLEQALLAASTLGSIDGLPVKLDAGNQLAVALQKAAAGGELTVVGFLQALPGHSATLDLERALNGLRRLKDQQTRAAQITTTRQPQAVDPALSRPGPLTPVRSTATVVVKHRPRPLELVVLQPSSGGNGRLVVISHGLWDGPESFEGWAQHLASHGYTVLLPVHPGSDSTQQQAMLSGKVPPPTPSELRYRPLDVSAVLDAAAQGRIAGLGRVAADRVVVMGHSWGATTALQLAGATPSSHRLRERCRKLDDPDRNLSWVLQCSFLDSADRAGLADRRVIAVAAVSPPLNLLFDQRAGHAMTARGLIVTGSRDWVVPPDPEAISRFEGTEENGHNLVVVRGGDHFNMRGPLQNGGGPLRALLVAWADAAFAAGAAVTPSPNTPPLLTPQQGWGETTMPMVLLTASDRRR